jgi:hypothetical protein
MSTPIGTTKAGETIAHFAARIEAQVLARIRDYLACGRPLAGLPEQSLVAQWIDAYFAVRACEDEERAEELRDLGTEFDLRGLRPPLHLVWADAKRFNQRFQKEWRKRKPDWAAIEQIETELRTLSDRLLDDFAGRRSD